MNLSHVLDEMIRTSPESADGVRRKTGIQIGLRGQAAPVGPGYVERHELVAGQGEPTGVFAVVYYKMFIEAMWQSKQGAIPRKVTLPIYIAPDEVVMIIDEPINAEGDSMIVPGRTPSGLHIPGGS